MNVYKQKWLYFTHSPRRPHVDGRFTRFGTALGVADGITSWDKFLVIGYGVSIL